MDSRRNDRLTRLFDFIQPRGKQIGKRDLDHIRQNKRDDADQKRVFQRPAHNEDEPSAPAEIDQSKRNRRGDIMDETRRLEKGQDEIKKRDDGERHNESARRGEKDGETAAEAAEKRKPDRTE